MLSNLTNGLPDLSGVASTISENIGEIKANIRAWFSDKKEALAEKWSNLTADIKDKTAEMRANIAQKWSDLKEKWSDISDNIQDKTVEMRANISQKWEDLKAKWSDITNNIQGKTVKFAGTITTTANAIKSAWEKIAKEWKNKTATFKLKFSAAAADLKKWVNTNVIDKINEKFKKVPILKNHTIPHLAQGGYVKKNTPQLAMIGDNRHQGEVVAPERKLEEMALRAASMAGGGVTPELIAILKEILDVLNALELNVYLDGKLLKKRIVDLINANTKATGVCEIIV